ncbi:MAG: methyltransferase domain-containing protein [Phycisphaerales bacterium]|nr:MAG: methyltransferase domain-containing protein [Phycisphaerales bacterium]
MKDRLLNLLVCPDCRQSFECEVLYRQDAEVIEGNLLCVKCKKKFPIRAGVPRLVPDHLSQEHQRTSSAFGWQWKHFSEMHDTFERQFLDWIYPIQPDFFKGKKILDAGCGIGRHIYYTASYEAQEVIGVDLSDAVEVAFENVGRLPSVHIIQADFLKPPFRSGTYDFAYSIGVLHHLDYPEAGFRSVASLVRAGGTILAWVYAYEGNAIIRHIIDPVRRKVTSRLPFVVLMVLSNIVTLPVRMVAMLIYRPLNKIGLKNGEYVSHYVRYKSGRETYRTFVLNGWPPDGPRLVALQDIADYVQAHSTPEDRIYIWSDDVQLYYLANRRCSLDFVWPLYVELPVVPGGPEEMKRRLLASSTRFVIIARDDPPTWLTRGLAENYKLVEIIEGREIYQRTDNN